MRRPSQDIPHDKRGQVAWITIDRPKQYNAFTGDTLKDLTLAFEDAGTDAEVGVIPRDAGATLLEVPAPSGGPATMRWTDGTATGPQGAQWRRA